ncbi:MAG: hypothetical protein KDD89_01020, partial [Anaerolineales bacterium]|nr:hypothetical protein [Anaerolineales bacterium]
MIPIYFTVNSIGVLANLVMAAVINVYLWRIQRKSRPTWLLLGATMGIFFFLVFWFLTSSL